MEGNKLGAPTSPPLKDEKLPVPPPRNPTIPQSQPSSSDLWSFQMILKGSGSQEEDITSSAGSRASSRRMSVLSRISKLTPLLYGSVPRRTLKSTSLQHISWDSQSSNISSFEEPKMMLHEIPDIANEEITKKWMSVADRIGSEAVQNKIVQEKPRAFRRADTSRLMHKPPPKKIGGVKGLVGMWQIKRPAPTKIPKKEKVCANKYQQYAAIKKAEKSGKIGLNKERLQSLLMQDDSDYEDDVAPVSRLVEVGGVKGLVGMWQTKAAPPTKIPKKEKIRPGKYHQYAAIKKAEKSGKIGLNAERLQSLLMQADSDYEDDFAPVSRLAQCRKCHKAMLLTDAECPHCGTLAGRK